MAKSIGELLINLRVAGESEALRKINKTIAAAKSQGKILRVEELKKQKAHILNKKAIKEQIDASRKLKKEQTLLRKEKDKLTNSFIQFSRVLSTAVVGSLAAVGYSLQKITTSSFQVGKAFTQSLQAVKAITGETDKDVFQNLENSVRKLGQSTSFTASQAANAMVILARSGIASVDSTEEASKGMENLMQATTASVYFAGAALSSLEASADLLVASLKQFGLGAENSAAVTDVFSVALKETRFDIQSLTAAMRYGGSIGKSFGMSIEETAAALAQFRNLGLEGSTAGTQFRMALSKASKETNKGTLALKKYGLTYDDINPSLNTFKEIMISIGKAGVEIHDIIKVFGVRQAGSIARISEQMNKTSSDYDNLLMKMRHSTGATKRLYTEMQDTVEKQGDIAKSAAQELQITMFKQAEGGIKGFLKTVTSSLQGAAEVTKITSSRTQQDFKNAFDALGKAVISQQKNIAALGFELSQTLVLAIKELAHWIPSLISGFRTLLSVFTAAIKVSSGLISIVFKVIHSIGFLINRLTGGKVAFDDFSSTVSNVIKLVTSLLLVFGGFAIVTKIQTMWVSFIAILDLYIARSTIAAASTTKLTLAITRLKAAVSLLGGITKVIIYAVTVIGTFLAIDWFTEENQSALDSATKAIEDYMGLLVKLGNAQKVNFKQDEQVGAVDALLKSLGKVSPKINEINKGLIDSIRSTRDWQEQFVKILNDEGELLTLQHKGKKLQLSVYDASTLALELKNEEIAAQKRFNSLSAEQKEKQASELHRIAEMRRLRKQIEVNLKNHIGTLKEESDAYGELNKVLATFKKVYEKRTKAEKESQKSNANFFQLLRSDLKAAIGGYKNLSAAQRNLMNEVSAGITSIDTFTKAMIGIGDASEESSRRASQANASFLKAASDAAARIDKKTKTKTETKRTGKSESQRLYEQRLKLIEKIMRKERDLNATSVEGSRNALSDKLKDLKEHFDKELKLHRNNARKTKEILSSQYRVERVLISNSLTEEFSALQAHNDKVIKQLAETKQTKAESREKEREEALQAVQDKRNEIASIAAIEAQVVKKQNRGFKKSGREKIMESSPTAPMQMESFDRFSQHVKEQQIIDKAIAETEAARLDRQQIQTNLLEAESNHRVQILAVSQAQKKVQLAQTNVAKAKAAIVEQSTEADTDQILKNQIAEFNAKVARRDALVFYDKEKKALAHKTKLLKEARDVAKVQEQRALDDTGYEQQLRKILQKEIKLKKRSKEREYEISEDSQQKLVQLGLTQLQINEAKDQINMKRKEHMALAIRKAEENVNMLYDAKRIQFEKETAQEIENQKLDLLNKEKSLMQRLTEAKDLQVAKMEEKDRSYADSLKKMYDKLIPQVVDKALGDRVDKYGKYTKAILEAEKKLADSQFKTVGFTHKKILGIDTSFLNKKTTLFADGQKSLMMKLLQIDVAFTKKMIDVEKRKADFIREFKGKENDETYKLQLAAFKTEEDLAEKTRVASGNKARIDNLKEFGKTLEKVSAISMRVVDAIKSMWDSLYSGILAVANLGINTFQKLTGFSFDLESGISSVMDAVKKAEEDDIKRGVVEGRLSPRMAQEAREGQAADPKSAAREFVDSAIADSVLFIETFAEAGPELIKRLAEKLPELTAKLSEELPKAIQGFAQALPMLIDSISVVAIKFIEIIVENLPTLIASLVSTLTEKLPDIVNQLAENLPILAKSLLDAIVKVLPILMKALIEMLPDLILVAVEAIVQLIPILINAFVFELLPKLPEIVGILVMGIAKGIGVLLLSIVKAIGDFLNLDTSGLGNSINSMGGSSYESPTGFHSGIPYVPKTMLARLHQGEAVIPSDVNARSQHPQNPAMAGSSSIGARMPMGTAQPIDIAVMAEGKLLDAVQVLAMDRGHAPKLNKKFRRASGVKVGFSRGKYTKYSN